MNQSLRELWDRIDVGVPPVAQISAQGDGIRRRRRLAMTAGAAAVVLVVGGGVSMRLLTDDAANVDVAAAGVPAPPQGMRWVGVGRAVVAVPEWWSTGETQCLAPVEDTVYFDQAAVAECVDAPSDAEVREVSALAVLDATGGYGEYELRSMGSIGEVDGREVFERPDCNEWFEGICRRLFAVPSEGVVFAVTIAEQGDGSYEEIRDSLRILPAGMTTVPLVTSHDWTPTWGAPPGTAEALAEKLKEAGLVVNTEVSDPSAASDVGMVADLPAGSYLGVSPELGSPIEVGGTVTITVMGPDGSPEDRVLATARTIAEAEAAAVEDADISSASVLVRPGTVERSESNVGRSCSSGSLIEVKLIGDFPPNVTTGYPVPPAEHRDFAVHALVVTADAQSGKICLKGVQTGNVEPEPGATDIPLG